MLTDGLKSCLYCGQKIRTAAIKCRHCGAWLEDSTKDFTASESSHEPAAAMGKVDRPNTSISSAAPVARLLPGSDATNGSAFFCTSCGKKNFQTATFCFACGNRILRPDLSECLVQQPSTPQAQPLAQAPRSVFRRLSPWWFAYFGYLALLSIALQSRSTLLDPIRRKPLPLSPAHLAETFGRAIGIIILPTLLVICYAVAKAIYFRSFRITISTQSLLRFLPICPPISAALAWLGAKM